MSQLWMLLLDLQFWKALERLYSRGVWGTCDLREHSIWPASEFSLVDLEYKIASKRFEAPSILSRYLDSKPEASIPYDSVL